MAKSVQIRARTDARTKQDAEEILAEIGINPSTAINMFYRQIVLRRGLPFDAELPNVATRAAIVEARTGEGRLKGDDLGQLLGKLLSRRERTFDVADLVESDPDLLEAAEKLARAAG
jgi:DNA-damage-inducible protein J